LFCYHFTKIMFRIPHNQNHIAAARVQLGATGVWPTAAMVRLAVAKVQLARVRPAVARVRPAGRGRPWQGCGQGAAGWEWQLWQRKSAGSGQPWQCRAG
jgi:hypothetical protein